MAWPARSIQVPTPNGFSLIKNRCGCGMPGHALGAVPHSPLDLWRSTTLQPGRSVVSCAPRSPPRWRPIRGCRWMTTASHNGVPRVRRRDARPAAKAKDEERLRKKWGKLGGLAVALSDEKQSTKAWASGAAGEERLGPGLTGLRRRASQSCTIGVFQARRPTSTTS